MEAEIQPPAEEVSRFQLFFLNPQLVDSKKGIWSAWTSSITHG